MAAPCNIKFMFATLLDKAANHADNNLFSTNHERLSSCTQFNLFMRPFMCKATYSRCGTQKTYCRLQFTIANIL